MRGLRVLLAASWAFATTVQAGPTPVDPSTQKADALFREGRTLLVEHRDPAGACAKFREAIEYDPQGDGIMLNLGLCNEMLGKYKSALYWFRKAQNRASESNAPDNERAAREHTSLLATKVATIAVAFAGNDSGATVQIDGEPIKPEDYAHVEVDPGHHVLDASAPGMRRVHQDFDVKGKGGERITIQLVPGDNTIVVDRGRARRRIAIGVAAGGAGLWIASVSVAFYEKSKYDDNKPAAAAGDMQAHARADHAAWVARWYGTGLFIAGSVALAGASYLYFTAPSREVFDQTVLAPMVSPDGFGLAAVGRF